MDIINRYTLTVEQNIKQWTMDHFVRLEQTGFVASEICTL